MSRISRIVRKVAASALPAYFPPVPPDPDPDPVKTNRTRISYRYLKGQGLEIGALHNPLPVSPRAKVKFVDRMTVEELRGHYPDLPDLVPVDVIDDGEKLRTVAAESQDFIIANHMLEHCQDPIGTLKNHLRVLKVGGILYLAIPDKRFTFDKERPLTTLDHLKRDHLEGPEWSRESHFAEWVKMIDRTPDDEFSARLKFIMDLDYSIHFHVWDADSFRAFLELCETELKLPFKLLHTQANTHEVLAILRRQPDTAGVLE